MKFIKSHIYLLLLFPVCYSQNSVPFAIRYQSNVKGDMTVIANNITNRIENNSANSAYNNRINSPKNNEEFQMGYIDIDSDESTFSSSSATLNLENQSNKKIIYAGLYWSATYKYESGIKTEKGKFIAQNSTRESIDKIKIKLPNQENYIDLTGQVIFDGINNKKYNDNAPYAVFADITAEVTKLENPFGNYTVANIRATNGFLKDGVASGWTMFFVYEDQEMSNKFIVCQDGFSRLSKKSTNILFTGFESLVQGNVNAKIAAAVLEGDKDKLGDQLFFKSAKKNNYVAYENVLRNQNNLFNSTITIGNDYIANRNPDSNNTLGYDTFLLSIPNDNNAIIANNSNEAKVRFKSRKDDCYLFFTAFNVEIKETIKNINPKEEAQSENIVTNDNNNDVTLLNSAPNSSELVVTTATSPKNPQSSNSTIDETFIKSLRAIFHTEPVIASTTKHTQTTLEEQEQGNNSTIEDENLVQIKPKVSTSVTVKQDDIIKASSEAVTQKEENSKEYFNYDISGVEQGYYIIVNVFAKESNKTRFVQLLRNKGFKANSFYNPIKNYHYVYIEESTNKDNIQQLFNSKINNSYQEDMWVLAVNNPSSSESYAINKKISKPEKKEIASISINEKVALKQDKFEFYSKTSIAENFYCEEQKKQKGYLCQKLNILENNENTSRL